MAENEKTDQKPDTSLDVLNEIEDLDPANKSLNEALQLSFRILRVVMVILIAVFIFSGWYNVKEKEVAVLLRFGEIVGEPGNQVQTKGGPYFAWPEPIDKVIRIPTAPRTIQLNDEFWFEENPADAALSLDQKAGKATGLAPGKDGSLLTGDQGIMHAKFTVEYQIATDKVADYLRNVGDLERAEQLVRLAASKAIVHEMASRNIDDILKGFMGGTQSIAIRANGTLETQKAGIRVLKVSMSTPTPPLTVRDAFNDVNSASIDKASRIDTANKERTTVLTSAAGAAYPAMIEALNNYELVRRSDDKAAIATAQKIIDDLFDGKAARLALEPLHKKVSARAAATRYYAEMLAPAVPSFMVAEIFGVEVVEADERKLRVERAMTDATVGGEVSKIIADAKTYRTSFVDTARIRANRFQRLLPAYVADQQTIMHRLMRQALQPILTSPDNQIWVLPSSQDKSIVVTLNQDIAQIQKREEQKAREAAGQTP